jgi:hypothetical protein
VGKSNKHCRLVDRFFANLLEFTCFNYAQLGLDLEISQCFLARLAAYLGSFGLLAISQHAHRIYGGIGQTLAPIGN